MWCRILFYLARLDAAQLERAQRDLEQCPSARGCRPPPAGPPVRSGTRWTRPAEPALLAAGPCLTMRGTGPGPAAVVAGRRAGCAEPLALVAGTRRAPPPPCAADGRASRCAPGFPAPGCSADRRRAAWRSRPGVAARARARSVGQPWMLLAGEGYWLWPLRLAAAVVAPPAGSFCPNSRGENIWRVRRSAGPST